jgi:hypothetical protein
MKFKKIALTITLLSVSLVGCQTMESLAKTGVYNPLDTQVTLDSDQFRSAVTNRSQADAMAHVRSEITRLYPNTRIITYNTTSGLIQTKAYSIKASDIPLHTDGTGKFTDAKATLTVIVTPISNNKSTISVGYHYLGSKNFTLTWKQYDSNGQLEQKAANFYAK